MKVGFYYATKKQANDGSDANMGHGGSYKYFSPFKGLNNISNIYI